MLVYKVFKQTPENPSWHSCYATDELMVTYEIGRAVEAPFPVFAFRHYPWAMHFAKGVDYLAEVAIWACEAHILPTMVYYVLRSPKSLKRAEVYFNLKSFYLGHDPAATMEAPVSTVLCDFLRPVRRIAQRDDERKWWEK
jgi:hypothetical protein